MSDRQKDQADPTVAPYGSWRSPISAGLVVAGSVRLGALELAGENLYWIESRPSEGGRSVIVRRDPDGSLTDMTPAPYNARTRVHEYGGGEYVVWDDTIYFSNFADQRLYRQSDDSIVPVTPDSEGKLRYADATIDRSRNRLIFVREDHRSGGEPENTLVAIAADASGGDEGSILASGYDFYSNPRVSPDGRRLAWVCWKHPNMPWDDTELWVAEISEDGCLVSPRKIAGGKEESIVQPEWSPSGELVFVSDRTGWWNLYRWSVTKGGKARPVYTANFEFGRPAWVFGNSHFGFSGPETIVAACSELGVWRLVALTFDNIKPTPITLPYDDISELKVSGNRVVLIAGSPTQPTSIVEYSLQSGDLIEHLRSNDIETDPGYLSVPRPIEFPTEGGLIAHAFFYEPKNKDFVAPPGEKPPLLVKSHGGPTSATSSTLRLSIQYWTSRGFGVLDVNYGGSTGYGREYRNRLRGAWGITDVDDCVNGAKYLAGLATDNRSVEVDANRLTIDGGSAGGYTTLAVLTFRDLFKAGASLYGVSDLEALARDTHKFESRYLDLIVGPYPERRDIYVERSPIAHVERLACPLIFFQGLEDKIVPPSQAVTMVEALKARGIPVAYLPFEGEQHGFRRAENIKRALEAEFYFFCRVFGITPADEIEPVEIHNLD